MVVTTFLLFRPQTKYPVGVSRKPRTGAMVFDQNFLHGILVSFDLTCSNKMWVQFERYHFADIVSSQSTMHRAAQLLEEDVFNKYVVQLFHLSRHFFICNPTAIAIATGTALPIWRATSTLFPTKRKSSGKVCNIAPSRNDILRFCSG